MTLVRAMSTCLLSLLLLPLAATPVANAPDFDRDVRPILSRNCFPCHGPDDEDRSADLRLDTQEGLFTPRDGRAPIVPRAPEASEAIRRLTAAAEDRMPPPDSNRSLSPVEIETLRRWVAEGATWERHWSFTAPSRPAVPPDESDWSRGPIDAFIHSRLSAAERSPSAAAPPAILVRRVWLDLLGLVPPVDEADAWITRLTKGGTLPGGEIDEGVWEELVDRLLGSAAYGEHHARRWLDLARYADTNGYEKDRDRSIWPYRDWVVSALDADMPFDRFTIEQIAGDMLPDADLSTRIATGFHRNTMLNEEGGIDPLEFRFRAMTDRNSTTATTWLGLTFECAQCHGHKFDPITQREYWQTLAFLDNADEPEIDLPDAAVAAKHAARVAEANRLLGELESRWPADGRSLAAAFDEWLARERRRTVVWTTLAPRGATSNLPHLQIEADGAIFASGDTTKEDTYEITFGPSRVAMHAIRLEALPDPRLPDHGPGTTYYEGRKGDFFLGEFELRANGVPVEFATASHSYAKNRFGDRGVGASLAIDGDRQTGWAVDGGQGERHVAVFVAREPVAAGAEFELRMVFGRHFASSLGRFRVSVAENETEARDLEPQVEGALSRSAGNWTEEDRSLVRRAFLLRAPELAEPAARIRDLLRRPEYPTTLVLAERPPGNPRRTHVHHRGEYLSPRERAEPSTPESLHPWPEGASRDRLGFARWLVAADNPLTARVTVNREWAAFFGRGLVETLDDFGAQGKRPTHPELLDWLAVEFVASGWSLKSLHRSFVTSATYRQASTGDENAWRDDAANLLLGRAHRRRLTAEALRDVVLAASGLLVERRGGPPVRPPQPDGVTESAWGSPRWNASSGADRYRRSIYTYLKRTAPFAMFQTFDAPSGEACVARRDVSGTALQALTVLNDVLFVDASRALGAALASQGDPDDSRVAQAFRRALTRSPDAEEIAILTGFVVRVRDRLRSGELNAAAITGASGDIETAAWTALARVILSLDEMMTRN